MAMLCAEWWGFEIHALIAGLKGTVALGAQSLILNTAQLAFMVPLGMGVAASTRVGNALGAGLPNRVTFLLHIISLTHYGVHMCLISLNMMGFIRVPCQHELQYLVLLSY
jgi:Na+-driven multidrug efflux pump